jgi:uncharacterized protein (TIGR01777 family)
MSESKHENNITSVLITGGSGSIGKHLTGRLLKEGYKVSHLTRKPTQVPNVKSFLWDPSNGIIDPYSLTGIDCIIHLAGANLGDRRWTEKRKSEIIGSRVESARLLFREVMESKIKLKAFITASATGIYGAVTSEKIFSETDTPGSDFTGEVCRKWEEAADMFSDAGIRTVKIRTAPVLERNDSAISKMLIPARFGFLVMTKGSQYMPWIHINDACNIYLRAVRDTSMNGAYNAVAPQHVTHKDFMLAFGKVLDKPVIPMPLPELTMRTVFGEMSDMILKGSRVSDEKILATGYRFEYGTVEEALAEIFSHDGR